MSYRGELEGSTRLGWVEPVGYVAGRCTHARLCLSVCKRARMKGGDCSGNCKGRAMCTKDVEAY